MQSKVTTVTPKLAAAWLERNHCNRPLSHSIVDKYRALINSGHFYLTHQGVAFDEHDYLRDGQHRLSAIVEANQSVKMLVTTGLAEDSVQSIDDGRKRTDQQALSMVTDGEGVSTFVTAITKEMYGGALHFGTAKRRRQPLRLELIEFYVNHREAIHKYAEVFKDTTTGASVSYVVAAIARASYHVPKKRIERFAEVLAQGYSKEGEEVIIRLRNYILKRRREQRQTQQIRDDIYGKTERAIEMYIAGADEKLEGVQAEMFALPHDAVVRAELVGKLEES